MTEINPNMAYYPTSPSASKKKKIGATIAGGLIGMNAYYLPVKKDVFVQKMKQMPKSQLLPTLPKKLNKTRFQPKAK